MPPGEKRFLQLAGVAALVVFVAYVAWMARRIALDPDVVFLRDDGPAQWIVLDEVVRPDARAASVTTRAFRTTVTIEQTPADAVLHVRALKHVNVRVDERIVLVATTDFQDWKTVHQVQLAPFLTPGRHEITIFAQNQNGPAAVWANAPAIGLHTDARWEGTGDGNTWQGTRLATARRLPELSWQFEPAGRAFLFHAPWLLGIVLVAGGAYHWLTRGGCGKALSVSPSAVRWCALAAWVALGANNITKLPWNAGSDAIAHLEYMHYLIEKGRIPFANEGWQMFQSPLYYLLSAPLLALLGIFMAPESAAAWIRIIPLLCGLAQIELCFRAVRLLAPARSDLQILGTLFAAVLPMNVYLSQFVGNEPLAGCLSSAVVLLFFQILAANAPPSRRTLLFAGTVWGLALLAKVSALLLAGPVVMALAQLALSGNRPLPLALRRFAVSWGWTFGAAALVAGWYYTRNWIHLGKPFVGGWEMSRGIIWWQDPGYRTWADFLNFGEVFTHPVYASTVSLWDGFYASLWSDTFMASALTREALPGWNYRFLLASIWFALVPTAALVVGAGRGLSGKALSAVTEGTSQAQGMLSQNSDHALVTHRLWTFSLVAIATFGFVFLHHFLTIPFYGVVKASYTLGLMPCYTVLAVAGLDALTRNVIIRRCLRGLLAAWALSVFCAYFVL